MLEKGNDGRREDMNDVAYLRFTDEGFATVMRLIDKDGYLEKNPPLEARSALQTLINASDKFLAEFRKRKVSEVTDEEGADAYCVAAFKVWCESWL